MSAVSKACSWLIGVTLKCMYVPPRFEGSTSYVGCYTGLVVAVVCLEFSSVAVSVSRFRYIISRCLPRNKECGRDLGHKWVKILEAH